MRWVPPAPGVSLDEAELGRLRRPEDVAAERDLEAGGQAEAVDQSQARDLERLQPAHGGDQLAEAIGGAAVVDRALEVVDVGAAGEELALGAPDECPGVGALD